MATFLQKIYLYGDSDKNFIYNNALEDNNFAIYIKTRENQVFNNMVTKNKIGVYLLETAEHNFLTRNDVAENSEKDLYPKTDKAIKNFFDKLPEKI